MDQTIDHLRPGRPSTCHVRRDRCQTNAACTAALDDSQGTLAIGRLDSDPRGPREAPDDGAECGLECLARREGHRSVERHAGARRCLITATPSFVDQVSNSRAAPETNSWNSAWTPAASFGGSRSGPAASRRKRRVHSPNALRSFRKRPVFCWAAPSDGPSSGGRSTTIPTDAPATTARSMTSVSVRAVCSGVSICVSPIVIAEAHASSIRVIATGRLMSHIALPLTAPRFQCCPTATAANEPRPERRPGAERHTPHDVGNPEVVSLVRVSSLAATAAMVLSSRIPGEPPIL